jgi:Cdc6-like AAA superfamily ATPase
MFYNCCGLKSKNLTCYSTVLDYIAHLSFINGWRARGIINIARDAAELADEMNDKMIEIRHIDEIAEIAPQKELKEIIKKLDPPALNILLFLLQRNGKGIEEDALDCLEQPFIMPFHG